jgi:hypothetical protein
MTEFTVRTTKTLGSQLSSAQMRSWIAEFLRQPHRLPPDPGAGEHRSSLSLPGESVRDLTACLRCSPSSALRRLALDAMRSSPAFLAAHSDDVATRDSTWAEPEDGDEDLLRPGIEAEISELIIALLFPVVCFAVWFFINYRKRKREEEAESMTTTPLLRD